MTEEKVRALFTLAGITIVQLWELPNGYTNWSYVREKAAKVKIPRSYDSSNPPPLDFATLEFLNEAVRAVRDPWWLVLTPRGHVRIGWRKRVIAIDWQASDVHFCPTKDDVTKSDSSVHAWTEEKALEYLKALAPYFKSIEETRELLDV